jgi:L-rhamnose mutarotase
MKLKLFKNTSVKAFMLAIFSTMLFALSAKAGVDSYSIYLNKKLLFKQSMDKPLSLQSLKLDDANPNDQLVVYYSQCNAPNKVGSGRSIVIKDAEGNKIKAMRWSSP